MLATIVSLVLVFYHPLIIVLVIFIMVLFLSAETVQQRLPVQNPGRAHLVYPITIASIVFATWSSYLYMLTENVIPITESVTGAEGSPPSELEQNIQFASASGVDFTEIIKILFNEYGQYIILGLLSLVSVGIIIHGIRHHQKPSGFQILSATGFLGLAMLSVFMLVTNGAFGFGRIYLVSVPFSIVLISSVSYPFVFGEGAWDRITRIPAIRLIGLFLAITCITYFSVFNLYLSPIVKQSNQQVLCSDYEGMDTFFDYRDDSIQIYEVGLSHFRFHNAILGREAIGNQITYSGAVPLDHFGYRGQGGPEWWISIKKYVLINDQGRRWYEYFYPDKPERRQFESGDFSRIRIDGQYDLVYSNQNLDVFMSH